MIMKKLLLVLVCVFAALSAFAQTRSFTDKLTITVNGSTTQVPSLTIQYQDNGDGTANFLLKNFYLSDGVNSVALGNITASNMKVTKGSGYDTFDFHDKIILTDGDAEALPEGTDMWMGPIMFPDGLLLDLNGKLNDEKMFVVFDIDLRESMGQLVRVQFGDDFSADDEDAVSGIAAERTSSTTVYDLSGRRVKTPSRGIYVVGGKKVLF
jgi:hypothetical protein